MFTDTPSISIDVKVAPAGQKFCTALTYNGISSDTPTHADPDKRSSGELRTGRNPSTRFAEPSVIS